MIFTESHSTSIAVACFDYFFTFVTHGPSGRNLASFEPEQMTVHPLDLSCLDHVHVGGDHSSIQLKTIPQSILFLTLCLYFNCKFSSHLIMFKLFFAQLDDLVFRKLSQSKQP